MLFCVCTVALWDMSVMLLWEHIMPENSSWFCPAHTGIMGHCQTQIYVTDMWGLTAVRVGLVEVRRGGWLNGQLRHRHLTRHRVSCTQTAHAAAIFSVRAHLENRERGERKKKIFSRTNICFDSVCSCMDTKAAQILTSKAQMWS